MSLLTASDFETHIYPELRTAIDRGNTALLQEAIASAESEARGYLSRFDRVALFSKTGTERDSALVMFTKDMAVWHFIILANPNTDMELRKTRYDDALRWLRGIQRGETSPEGWPLPEPEVEASDIIVISSAPKRSTRY